MPAIIDMTGKVALVTGAGGGIGRATCVAFSATGARVAASDINARSLASTVAELRRLGSDSEGFGCDITDFSSVTAMVKAVVAHFGQIDVLANVAGGSVNKTSPFLSQDPNTWFDELKRNLLGSIYVCRAVLDETMFARKTGVIVTVSSDAGRVGSLGEGVYSAAKGGQISFTKSLAREMGRHGIRVNCISPGPTDTPQVREAAASAPKVMEKIVSMIAMKRIATPEEQAQAIVFLASDWAGYITGQVISVNGGLQML
jgi:2-hydroxycyclohexanecarboxyl-CoA dehydrogenase